MDPGEGPVDPGEGPLGALRDQGAGGRVINNIYSLVYPTDSS